MSETTNDRISDWSDGRSFVPGNAVMSSASTSFSVAWAARSKPPEAHSVWRSVTKALNG